jgi:SAM-dependent methyltransferase
VTVAGDAHWDNRYQSIGADAVSWYQDRPSTSLELLSAVGAGPDDAVIDVGGGASNLVDHLVRSGYRDVSVLDVSSVALEVARSRVGDNSAASWLVQDLLTWEPERTWEVWHDRAVLHFLLTDEDRSRYVGTLRRALKPGGAFIIGTFAEDGPTECSALPVRRHAPGDLRELIGDGDVVDERREVHETPSGAMQPFNWIAGRLRS